MKKLMFGFILTLAALCASPAKAQTLTKSFSQDFTFGPSYSTQYSSGSPTCSPITSITGWSGTGGGEVCYGSDYYGANIDVPFQLGFLNNGYLDPCSQMHFGAPVWLKGNATTVGSIYYINGSTTCPYFTGEYGTDFNSNDRLDGFTVMIEHSIASSYKTCRLGRCVTHYVDIVTGGTGTITDWLIN